MRLQILSDVHTEFHKDYGEKFISYLKPDGVDILAIAGDLGTLSTIPQTVALLSACYSQAQILYVPGNHDYYGSSFDAANEKLQEIFARHTNTHLLNNEMIEIGGVQFVGSPLWFKQVTDYQVFAPLLADFKMIYGFHPRVFAENKEARRFLNWHVNRESVVITHHMPSNKSVAEIYKVDGLNIFFVCDIEKLINLRQPKLWVHGHTHKSCNYLIGKTHVVCNPLGYIGRTVNEDFIPNMCIDL